MPIPQRLPGSRTERSNLFISAPTFKQLQSNREVVDSALLASKQYTHARTHTQGNTHIHTVLHMLKPLSCCLLSHYSIACYFLKQEKAIYPQRSAERSATRLSPGIREVTLKSEECGEVGNLRNTDGKKKKKHFWKGEASFAGACSQSCVRCPRGGSIIDITDDGAEKFQSTNGTRRN